MFDFVSESNMPVADGVYRFWANDAGAELLPVEVQVAEEILAEWERERGVALRAAERYGVARTALTEYLEALAGPLAATRISATRDHVMLFRSLIES